MTDLEHATPIVIVEDEAPPPPPRNGFLPIATNAFDRCFISFVLWVALSLFWFRFVEPMGVSIHISNAIAFALAVLIVWKG